MAVASMAFSFARACGCEKGDNTIALAGAFLQQGAHQLSNIFCLRLVSLIAEHAFVNAVARDRAIQYVINKLLWSRFPLDSSVMRISGAGFKGLRLGTVLSSPA
jgi:hypothetical protein